MVFKKLFKGGGRDVRPDEASSIEDLIVLERYDEAVDRLKARLKLAPEDLHSHLRLAEAYLGQGERGRALDEFLFVADEYAQDGFYDRGIALLSKAKRYAPTDPSMDERIERLQLAKASERNRGLAVEGLREGRAGATAAIALERLWHKVAASDLIRHLPSDILRRFFSTLEPVTLEKGVKIERAGTSDDRLLLVVDGLISARMPNADPDTTLAPLREFGPGDVIGETVLLERKPWPADYIVSQDGKALALDRAGLEKALQGNPDPRGFLTTLRMQHNDHHVAKIRAQLE